MAHQAMPKARAIRIRAMVKERRLQRLAGIKPTKTEHWRPQTRADCDNVPRPCPYVGCRHHLFIDVYSNGSIRFPRGDTMETLEAMHDSCSLDVAEERASEVQEIAEAIGVSSWYAGHIIAKALATMGGMRVARELAE